MKKIFLLITNINYMAMAYKYQDNNIEETLKNSESSKKIPENEDKQVKKFYKLYILVSTVNFLIFLFNYIFNDNQNLIGLIFNAIQLFINIVCLSLDDIKYTVVKFIIAIYLFSIPWVLILNSAFNQEDFYKLDEANQINFFISFISFVILNMLSGFLIYKSVSLQYKD